jgi:histidyl-tRNA synthetase
MSSINAPKGTQDFLPDDTRKWQAVERIAREVAELYHFGEIRTPVFEHTELFHRGVGETTDIVSKETYTFADRDNRSMTLRPEGTAGVVRAVIENGLLNDEGARVKVYYIGPNFRYERPQKGRYRQHHQFGVEAFGVAAPEQDVECIVLQMNFYARLRLKGIRLHWNTLGDRESKAKYSQALKLHLAPKFDRLSEDSQRRFHTNPLRILDSKDPRDQEACSDAPDSLSFLSLDSDKHRRRVEALLETQVNALNERRPPEEQIVVLSDPNLVRGFDYYTGTVWEVTVPGLGAQNAIGGGGRYDNLVELLGGRPTPAVGFGSGLERLLMALQAQDAIIPIRAKPLIWLISLDDVAFDENLQLLSQLRLAGFAADMDLVRKKPKSQFRSADREGAAFCLLRGETERSENCYSLKDMRMQSQMSLPRHKIVESLGTVLANSASSGVALDE